MFFLNILVTENTHLKIAVALLVQNHQAAEQNRHFHFPASSRSSSSGDGRIRVSVRIRGS
jgi:hypothetical protein